MARMLSSLSMISPYTRLVGKYPYGIPPVCAVVQTYARFERESLDTRVAAVLRPSVLNCIQKRVVTVQSASTAREADWHSIAFGLQFALEEGEQSILLENENLAVIHGLITPGMWFLHKYARHFKDQILRMARNAEYVGARWIPKDTRRTDVLFREHPLA